MRAELKPLRSYALPKYPTWALVEAEPALLARMIPRRWEGKGRLAAALAAAVFGLGGAGALVGAAAEKSATPTPPPPSPMPTPKATPVASPKPAATAKPSATPKPATTAQPATRPVAIVFEHGDGRGSFGCEAVAAPAYLTEDEARQAITSELELAGLKLAADGQTVPGVLRKREYVTRYDPAQDREVGALEETKDPPTELVLDGWDADRKVGFEFISSQDYEAVGGVDGGRGSSVSSVDYREAAQNLARKLNAAGGDRTVGVFYDPLAMMNFMASAGAPGATATPESWEQRLKRLDAAARDEARESLRRQVRDFAAWLKAQGILQ